MADLPTSVTGGPTGIDPNSLRGDPGYPAYEDKLRQIDLAEQSYQKQAAEAAADEVGPAPTIQGAIETRNEVDKADPFTALPPVDHLNDLMAQSPWLIGLVALGGKSLGVPAQAMLSATNGMVSGLIKGDQQGYQTEKDKYDAEYARYEKRHNEIFTIYKDFQQAYKASYGAHQSKLKAADTLKNIVGEKQWDANQALKAIEASRKFVDSNRALNIKQQTANASTGGGSSGGGYADEGLVGMVKEGAPPGSAVKGMGRIAGIEWSNARKKATQEIADEMHISLSEAGAELARRQVDYVAGRSSTTQMTKVLGAIRPAVSQLDKNTAKATEILKVIPSSDFSPILNAVARGEEKWTGDPKYSSLFFLISGIAKEAARITSGGTLSAAQLNVAAAAEAKKWLDTDSTPESMIAPGGLFETLNWEGKTRIEVQEKAIEKQRGKRDDDKPGNKYASADDVKAAFKAGKITREEAMAILKKDFKMGD